MREFEARFANQVIHHRYLVIFVSLVLVAIAASGARHLSFTNSYRVYFGPEDPHLLAYETLENTYTKDDSIMFVLAPADGVVFSRDFLTFLEAFTERAWQVPFSNRVESITNFQHTVARGDDLDVGDLVYNAAALSDADLQRVEEIALTDPQLRSFLIASDAAVTAVNVNILLPGVNETQEQPLVFRHVRALVDSFNATHPEIAIYVSGMGAFHNSTTESAISDMSVRGPLSFLLMFLLVAFLAGGLIGTLTTLFVFSMSVVAAMGISGYLGFPITPSGAAAPNIILTVALANCVHVLISYFHELREGRDKQVAAVESLRINLNPIALASVTTAIGFLSMNFSEAPPFQMMGTTVAIGVLVSFLLAITFLPALLTALPTGRIRAKTWADNAVERLGELVVRRRGGLLWGMSAVIVVMVANVPRNEFNDLFLHVFDESMEFRRASDFMVENLTGIYGVHYSLDAGTSGGITDPEFLRDVDRFVAWWREQPETEHVSSITDTMKRLNKNMNGDDPEKYDLPDRRELAAQYLLLYEMSLPYGLDLNNQINVDKSSTRVVATLKPLTITETLDVTGRAGRWLDENAPKIGHDDGSGMVMMFTHLMLRNIVTMVVGTTVALGLISLLIVLALRSIRIGALSLVTNLAPLGMGFGIWALIDGHVGMGVSVVASMTFGIVVDDTVHFLSKYLRARREQALSPENAVLYTFRTVGRALIVTSIVLVCGFLVLSTSPFGLNADMGLSVAIVIACALVTVLLFLPPLLIRLERRRG
ncbi:MAG: MMPL family transporter [Myxococcales bacterium]|nr:MMPL family transporter [Myxococcales bacterium]